MNYTIGTSDPSKDWVNAALMTHLCIADDLIQNYVHYSRYGGSFTRPEYVLDNVNAWTVNWVPEGGLDVSGKTA